MGITRHIMSLSATLLLLSAAVFPAAATPLPAGTLLTIDPGVNDASSPACQTGSCFTVRVSGVNFTAYYNLQPGTDGGIVIGKSQARGLSPEPGELANFVRIDTVEAPGSMFTTPYFSDLNDASANKFDDQSCSSSSSCAGKTVLGAWNKSGGFGLSSILGTSSSACAVAGYPSTFCPGVTKWTMTPAGAPGIDGDRYVLEYVRLVNDTLDGQFHNTFAVHLEGTIVLPSVEGVDLAVELTAAPNPATQNSPLTYTATVRNNGAQTASSVNFSDTLPPDVDMVSVTPSQGSCNGTAVISCALGDLAGGGSAMVQITVTLNAAGTLVNSVSVNGVDTEANVENNNAASSVVVNAPPMIADLGVTMTAGPNPVKRLSNLTYSINISNSGPDSAGSVLVYDTLPFGFSVVSVNSNQGTCGVSGRTVYCSFETLMSGGNASMTIVVRPLLRGSYSNTVRASSSTQDSNTGNNSARVTVRVR
ncbi:MAG TPA: DUF11 domain-containing protein [Gammaproteobacteria bacterium]